MRHNILENGRAHGEAPDSLRMRHANHFAPRKKLGFGALCLLAALACSAPEEAKSFTVVFEMNAEDAEAGPQSKTIAPPESTLGTLPAQPTRPGHVFAGWNTQADGSGMAFDENTPVEEDMVVYAQWGRRLFLRFPLGLVTLTPMEGGGQTSRSTSLNVEVSGFLLPEEANEVRLAILPRHGLSFLVEDGPSSSGVKSFRLRIEYDGKTPFAETSVALGLRLQNLPKGYAEQTHSFRMEVLDGQRPERAIALHQSNIQLFNNHAATADGLTQHYKLTQHVALPPPSSGVWGAPPSNWKPIGSHAAPFAGSFDGGGFTLAGLSIDSFGDGRGLASQQGFFGYIGEGARVENLGLTGVHIVGKEHVGGLAGVNSGLVRNCYATGRVEGTLWVGGLLGNNHGGMVHNCYVTASVKADNHAGGVAGSNSGTLQNCMALGPSVIAPGPHVGRVAGSNHRTLADNHAFDALTRDGVHNTRWTNIGPNHLDGTSKTTGKLQTESGFPEALRRAPWTYESGKLPGFGGKAVEMPPHLR